MNNDATRHLAADACLVPLPEPSAIGRLPVDARHTLYWEECGNRDGPPVMFLHGGPGGGCLPHHRRFFDPDYWRIVLFDQRGAGRSTPNASVIDNPTWTLVADLEKLRAHLGIDRFVLFGGSWGRGRVLRADDFLPDKNGACWPRSATCAMTPTPGLAAWPGSPTGCTG